MNDNQMGKQLKIGAITEYSEILKTYGLEYKAAGPYWQVGKIDKVQGWILHLSVVVHQLQDLLELVIPELVARGISFKVIMTEELALQIGEGGLGYIQLGKMLRIYPEDDMTAYTLAKDLIALTGSFRGPAIPTDRHLGSIVYARYGSFNPVEIDNGSNQPIKCIYNAAGKLIPDPYVIPFSLPEDIPWPFSDLAAPVLEKKPKLLNARYYPISVIKPDAKGSVIRALYFKKPWQISSCIIKQGNPNMFSDAANRDIRDRLEWQYDLYQDLRNDVPLPKVFDHFTIDDTVYLAMEFINGISLTTWIGNIFRDRCWLRLSRIEKSLLLDKLLNIFDIIDQLHKKGYIHRDITPDNFLVDKKGRLFMVDMELAWSEKQHRPDPPFRLGTSGHMSPEQKVTETPTVKEDIYGIGGTMIMIFTNMHAVKFHQHSPESIRNVIHFLTGEKELGDITASCLQVSSAKRPDLNSVRNTLRRYRDGQLPEAILTHTSLPNGWMGKKPEELIQMGLLGLIRPELMNQQKLWISLIQKAEIYIGNEQMELTLSEGWHTGMTGVLWLVARAKNIGFKVDVNLQSYTRCWEYLFDYYFPHIQSKAPSLYNGAAGVAMSVVEGLKSGLLIPDESQRLRLQACFLTKSNILGLATGLAGQGLSLLNSSTWLDPEFFKKTLDEYIRDILAMQLADGAWPTGNISRRRINIITGMDYGVAGITWFLLCCFQRNRNSQVEVAAKKALHWLSMHFTKKNGRSGWPVHTGSQTRDIWNWSNGTPGIALTFIKAYEIWRDPLYKTIAEEALSNHPATPCRMDLSLATGLTGLGEVYLEAARVFANNEWQQRCDWIASLLTICGIRSEEATVHWLVGWSTTATADLFTGSSGILHFCMSYLNPEKSLHPLSI